MRKFMILGALVALVVAALALPALAQQVQKNDFFGDNPDNPGGNGFDVGSSFDVGNQNRVEASDNRAEDRQNRADEGFFGNNGFDRSNAQDWWDNNNWWDDNNQNNDTPAVSQENEQSANSGDLNQRSSITGGGDNSNQCVGQQITGNTGNAQNQIGVLQYASEGEFEFDDSGASINVSPTNKTSCNQQVNQAASAFGGR